MKTIRTPDDRFDDLPGFPYAPNYAEVSADGTDGATLRVHYLDEGPADADPIVLMHGEPTWSYLYRHMIGPLVDAGHRVIAPDMVGFGRSDKPTEQGDHSYARHVEWMTGLVFDHLDLRHITLFCQDWGGLIGLRLVAAEPDRFDRVVVGNTGLPTGHGAPSEAFLAWQSFSQSADDFPVGAIIGAGCTTELSADVVAAYDAPFPDDAFKAGPRVMPALVPTSTADPASAANIAAWEVLGSFERPLLTAFSDGDPITAGGAAPFESKVPGAQGQQHSVIKGGGHFLQEDRGPQLASVIDRFIADNPVDTPQ
ncbi:haloalkane dehalogenase [Candidatus Neomicrothrix sp.]|jgi:haloalkane dehalogenase|uniref:haloalkane dehalogenase n=1 Tax=Candidatus Neomicrothrix sp. TaxID=2719034 RepID=UPI001B49B7E5|nr:haloalkane dehalogenase [Candidatus Microthrix sp.]MBK6437449.1 haloalkane dehalogenase [Candidatus Microthrix sp.]MBK6969880.1 haloalkane dehalogenase [Candidatus Microthrix sp.]MBK7165908.1 haloalkane dehalogenase [Candidatus Microthrix sp.]MBP7595007.1 haloalkane dehalogenase [Candidatus Microthrix sp.]MBP9066044.1 haloalkane dehalogenase [Candidatus Microthrix sp.]